MLLQAKPKSALMIKPCYIILARDNNPIPIDTKIPPTILTASSLEYLTIEPELNNRIKFVSFG